MLRLLLTFPWRERTTPLGDRAVVAHVGGCVFLCCNCERPFGYQLCKVKVDIGSAKIINFCMLVNKYPPPSHPYSKACAKLPSRVDFAHALTFGWNGSFGAVMSTPPPKNIGRLISEYKDCKKSIVLFFASNLIIAKFQIP